MSGRPYKYDRAMAIAQLMRDFRRPAVKKAAEDRTLEQVFLDVRTRALYVSFSDTIDWVPKLSRLSFYGRQEMYILDGKPEIDGEPYYQFKGGPEIKPIAAWPTEVEIAAEIALSALREEQGGSLSTNDLLAITRMPKPDGNSSPK